MINFICLGLFLNPLFNILCLKNLCFLIQETVALPATKKQSKGFQASEKVKHLFSVFINLKCFNTLLTFL